MNNLKELKQYYFDRDLFVDILSPIYDYLIPSFETDNFKFWFYDDELYLLHKPSGTLLNWYKHLGRTNTCNKNLSINELKDFVKLFLEDMVNNNE